MASKEYEDKVSELFEEGKQWSWRIEPVPSDGEFRIQAEFIAHKIFELEIPQELQDKYDDFKKSHHIRSFC